MGLCPLSRRVISWFYKLQRCIIKSCCRTLDKQIQIMWSVCKQLYIGIKRSRAYTALHRVELRAVIPIVCSGTQNFDLLWAQKIKYCVHRRTYMYMYNCTCKLRMELLLHVLIQIMCPGTQNIWSWAQKIKYCFRFNKERVSTNIRVV